MQHSSEKRIPEREQEIPVKPETDNKGRLLIIRGVAQLYQSMKNNNTLTVSTKMVYNPPIRDVDTFDLGGLIMNGVIRCNKDGAAINKKTKICPKCGGIKCHIAVFWHEKLWRYYKDTNDITFSYMSALSQLAAMNREIEQKTFKADAWEPGAIKERKLEQCVNRWLEEKYQEQAQNKISYGSYYVYRSHVNNHILNDEYGLGKWDVREIGSAELKRFAKSIPSRLIIKTQRDIVHSLRTIFSWLAEEEVIPYIPKFPTVKGNNSKKRKALSIDDQAIAIEKIPLEHRDLYEFETETGVRPGETCALKIEDFDFKTRTVTIRRTFTIGKLRESDKEGHKEAIPLTPRAFEIAQQRAHKRFPAEWLFINPRTKNHYTVQFLSFIWRKFTELPITHYEGTRHSYCTQIVEVAGLDAAQGLLRHLTRKSTEGYNHTRIEFLRIAQAKRTNVVDLNKVKEQKNAAD